MAEDKVDDDPLELKDLAVNFDYLMFRINDHLSNLSETTYQSVTNKKKLIEEEFFDKQLQIDERINEVDSLILECKELEVLFMKLDQLYMFVGDFKSRLLTLENEFKNLG